MCQHHPYFQISVNKPQNVRRILEQFFQIENWKHGVDNGKVFRALLTDLSKAFLTVFAMIF